MGKPRLKIITVKLPKYFIEDIDRLVKEGKYTSRSEVIRMAIRDLLKKEVWDKK